MNLRITILFFILFISCVGFSQQTVFVDKQGIMRWTENNEEIRLFGVNYTLPFAHGYRAINYIDADHERAIDADVYHMARLGFDAHRIHVWDCEISDSLGNVIPTEQLKLLDYVLYKMKERGIKTILTPLKIGGNGYPEPSKETPGFSSRLWKNQTYDTPSIIEKEIRYLTQFLNHVNPYTGLAYKNDPDIIALEVDNEPQHYNAKIATSYINKMVKAIRQTGFENPVFYNVSERPEFIEAYCKADIQGCTFQWYPTGLVSNWELKGNLLPNVDQYQIPFADNKHFKNKARMIYEFDPSDTRQFCLYPAMARSFREAKFQFAAQFAYDPLYIAYANTEYQTHYMNLAFSPGKALSMMIASEVFHAVPNGKSYGRFPENLTFESARLDYENNLAEWNSNKKFIYTNHTESSPVNIRELTQVAGCGNSPVVKYDGTGAYFLDKIKEGVWRLEVMPDALWVRDPYEKASLKKTVSVVQYNTRKMKIELPGLSSDFEITPLNEGNDYQTIVEDNQFNIRPGTYLIKSDQSDLNVSNDTNIANLILNEFVAPEENVDQLYVVHTPREKIYKSEDISFEAKILAPEKILKAELVSPVNWNEVVSYEMSKSSGFSYAVDIPAEKINEGSFEYYLVVHTSKGATTFPGAISGFPNDWDFVSKEKYTSLVSGEKFPVLLYNGSKYENIIWPLKWKSIQYNTQIISGKIPGENSLLVDIENLNPGNHDFTFRVFVRDKFTNNRNLLKHFSKLVVKASSGNKGSQKVQVALVLRDGSAFGKILELTPEQMDVEIELDDLKQVEQVLLPRPFPQFQAYWFDVENATFNIDQVEAIQISVGPGIPENEFSDGQTIEIEKIYLQ